MDNIVVGRTKVRVVRKDVNEKNGHETVKEIHRGVIVSYTTSFARVYNPSARDKGGDSSPQAAEAFPLRGRRCWCEPLGELEDHRAIVVPADMRN
jgi:hypothetical protein